jgi:hypothetical protein
MATAGAMPVDYIDIGLLDALQELAGIRRERLDVAPLAFGINGVEGERRLARTRNPGHHRQLVVRNFEVDVLQVMDACSAYDDALVRHCPGLRHRPHRFVQNMAPKLLIIAG